jgi:hypothetical protein
MQRISTHLAGVLAVSALVSSLTSVVATRAPDDWPQWRGPNRDGVSAEKGLLKDWPQGGPPLAWRTTGAGEGYSSMAISQGRMFTLGARGNTEYVIAFDAASGKKLWEAANGRKFDNDMGGGPRRRSRTIAFTRSARAAISACSTRRRARCTGRSTC